MNHDMTTKNSPLRHVISLMSSQVWGNRFVLTCASDVLIRATDTITFTYENDLFVKDITVDVLETQLVVREDNVDVYVSLVQFDR